MIKINPSKTTKGHYYNTVVSRNGKTLHTSEQFNKFASAMKNAKALQKSVAVIMFNSKKKK